MYPNMEFLSKDTLLAEADRILSEFAVDYRRMGAMEERAIQAKDELMREGLSDYHCRSDAYLLEDLCAEWRKKRAENAPSVQK